MAKEKKKKCAKTRHERTAIRHLYASPLSCQVKTTRHPIKEGHEEETKSSMAKSGWEPPRERQRQTNRGEAQLPKGGMALSDEWRLVRSLSVLVDFSKCVGVRICVSTCV